MKECTPPAANEGGEKGHQAQLDQYHGWIDIAFGSDKRKITLGSPKMIAHEAVEQYGVHVDGRHIGDIYAPNWLEGSDAEGRFEKEVLLGAVQRVLVRKQLQMSVFLDVIKAASTVHLGLNEMTWSVMRASGIQIVGDEIIFDDGDRFSFEPERNLSVAFLLSDVQGQIIEVVVTEKKEAESENRGRITQFTIEEGDYVPGSTRVLHEGRNAPRSRRG